MWTLQCRFSFDESLTTMVGVPFFLQVSRIQLVSKSIRTCGVYPHQAGEEKTPCGFQVSVASSMTSTAAPRPRVLVYQAQYPVNFEYEI